MIDNEIKRARYFVESDENYIALLKKANKDLGDLVRERDKQLAAAQAREQQLRNLLEHAPVSSGVCCCGDSMDRHPDPMVCGHSPVDQWDWAVLSLLKETQDTTALEAIVEKAGEVMRERAATLWLQCSEEEEWNLEEAIRALPGVTLTEI